MTGGFGLPFQPVDATFYSLTKERGMLLINKVV